MKTCKKCTHYQGSKRRTVPRHQGGYSYHAKKFCKGFNIHIHSTLNAKSCSKYNERANC